MNIPQFLLAAPTSGSGKTTISRGLMALLTRKGLKVQPFKCGPDYIDTKYHAAVCGRPSVNLDTFMASEPHVRRLYARYAADADACVVEGMMGMFDGYDRDRGSSASIAQLLHLSVVLVVDAKSAAYSVAPLLFGFLHFRPEVQIAGVIFNRVGSARHYEMLREVCDDLQVPCFGYLPKHKSLEQASRYLGLDFSRPEGEDALQVLTDLLEQHLDWPLLLDRCISPRPLPAEEEGSVPGSWRICVARNEDSFSFLYEEHLALLRRMGEVTFFDPEQSFRLPADTDLLYLPGGYPERHAEALARASETRASIRAYIERGGRTLAECGGMIYLSQGICSESLPADASSPGVPCFHPMVQLFPFSISDCRADRKLSLGYRSCCYNGQQLRGHEFHYTQFRRVADGGGEVPASVASFCNAKGQPVSTPLFRYKNTIAGYTHLYWGEIDLLRLFDDPSDRR